MHQPQPQTIALSQAPPPLGRGGSILLGRGMGVGGTQPILRMGRLMPANELLRHRMGQEILACPEFLHRQTEGPHKPYDLQWGSKGARGPSVPPSLSADVVGYTGGSGGGARVSVGVSQQYASSVAAQHPPPNSTPQVQQATPNPQLRGQAPPSLAHNPLNAAGGLPSSVSHSQHQQHISHHHSTLAAHHSVLTSANVSGATGGIVNTVQPSSVAAVNQGPSPAPPVQPHELNAQAIPQPSPQQIQQVALPGTVSGAHSIMYPSSNPNAHPQTPQSNAQVRRLINGQFHQYGHQNVIHTAAQQHRQVMTHPQPNMQNFQYIQHVVPPYPNYHHQVPFQNVAQHRPGASTQPPFQQLAQPHHTGHFPPLFPMQGFPQVVENNGKAWNNMKTQYQQAPSPHTVYYGQQAQQTQQQPPKTQNTATPAHREKNIIPIIDPETKKNILDDISAPNKSNPSPLQSRESSAANTPAPGDVSHSKLQQSSDIASQFALQVVIKADESNLANDQSDTVDCAISTINKSIEPTHSVLNSGSSEKERIISVDSKLESFSNEVIQNVPELKIVSNKSEPPVLQSPPSSLPSPQPLHIGQEYSPIVSQPPHQTPPPQQQSQPQLAPQPQRPAKQPRASQSHAAALSTGPPPQGPMKVTPQQHQSVQLIQQQPQPQLPQVQHPQLQYQQPPPQLQQPPPQLQQPPPQLQQPPPQFQQPPPKFQQPPPQLLQQPPPQLQQPPPQLQQPQPQLQQPQPPPPQLQQPQPPPPQLQQHQQPPPQLQQTQQPPPQLQKTQQPPPQLQQPQHPPPSQPQHMPKQPLLPQQGKQNQGQPKSGGGPGVPVKGNQNTHGGQASKGAPVTVVQQKGAPTHTVHPMQQPKQNLPQPVQQVKLQPEAQSKMRAAPQQIAPPQHIQQTSHVLPTQQSPASSTQGPPPKTHGPTGQGPLPQTQVLTQQKGASQGQGYKGAPGARKVSGEQAPPTALTKQEKRNSPPVTAAAPPIDSPKEAPSTARQSGKTGTPSPVLAGAKKEVTPEPGQQTGKRGKDKGAEDTPHVKEGRETHSKGPTENAASRLPPEAAHGKQTSQGKLQKTQPPSGENKVVETPAAPVAAPAPSQTPKSESPVLQSAPPKGHPAQASTKAGNQAPAKAANEAPPKVVTQTQEAAEIAPSKEPQQPQKVVSEEHVNNIDEAKVLNHEGGEPSGDTPKPASSLLKYPYKEGQWSPDNPDGKLQYDRAFLLEMQKNPLSLKRPDSLPNLEVVLDGSMSRPMDNRTKRTSDFTPEFLRNPSWNRNPAQFMQQKPMSKNSHQGNKKGQRIIDIKLSSSSEIKLKTSENAWKPTNKKAETCTDEDEVKHQDTLKKMRGILNKLTPDNFQRLLVKVQAMQIEKFYTFDGVIGLIFEKAVDEQSFSTTYAELCRVLSAMSVKAGEKGDGEAQTRFRNLIINKCQTEFERDNNKCLKREEKEKEIALETDPEKKLELKAMLDYEETRLRKRSVGNIRFIGELYKLKMLTSSIMMRILIGLLEKKDEESLECLCKLLTTIGKILETSAQNSQNSQKAQEDLNDIFLKMKTLVEDHTTSSRVRFLMMDVIDQRKNCWVPRREDAKPKTKAQVHEDIRKEEIEQQIALSNAPRKDDRERKRNRDTRGMVNDDSGWSTVTNTRRGPFDSSRLRNNTFVRNPVAENQVELRATGFGNWARGSSGGLKEQVEEPRPTNRFSVLGNQFPDENRRHQMPPRLAPGGNAPSFRQGGGGSFGSKSMPPPSEKEAHHPAKMMMPTPGDRSKSNSRSNSRTSSRDNSVARDSVPQETSVRMMDKTVAEAYSKAIIEEYVNNFDLKEACLCIREKFLGNNIILFVTFSLEWVIDRDAERRKKVGILFNTLLSRKQLTPLQFQEGSKEIMEMMSDLAIDVPQIYTYMGEILCRLLMDGAMNFKEILKVAEPAGTEMVKTLVHVIKQAALVVGEARISELWKSSGLRWEEILPDGADVKEYLSRYKIEFTINGPQTSPVTPATADENAPFDPKVVRLELMKLFKREASEEEIFGWIDVHVGSYTNTKKFVRALTTALIESLLITSDGGSVVLSDNFEDKLKNKAKFIHKYVDNHQALELSCIYGMQSLSVELQHPPGLLEKAFNALYDHEVLSEDAFFEWEKDDNPEEQVGKGVCITSVKKFLMWLREDNEQPD